MRTKLTLIAAALAVVVGGLYVGYSQQTPPPAAYEYLQKNAYFDEQGERHETSEEHVYLYADGTKMVDRTIFKPVWGASVHVRQWFTPDGTIRTEFPLVGRVVTAQNTPEQTSLYNTRLYQWANCDSKHKEIVRVGSDVILGYDVEVFELARPTRRLRFYHAPELGCATLLQQTYTGDKLSSEQVVSWVRKGNPSMAKPAMEGSAVESKPSEVVEAFGEKGAVGCTECEAEGLVRLDAGYERMKKQPNK